MHSLLTNRTRRTGAASPGLVSTLALAALLLTGLASVAGAQVSLTGPIYVQDFNTLALTGTSSTVPTGWAFLETGTNANTLYTAGTGSSTTGDTYSFGAASIAERAFGGLLSGALNPTIGASFQNNTGSAIGSLTISYTGEEWRLGTAARTDRLDFQYSLNATTLSTGTWTDVNALDFTTPNTGAAVGALDGNATGNRTAVSNTFCLSTAIPAGSTFWIRWTDFNAAGSDDGLSVDDFSLTPFAETPTTTLLDVQPSKSVCGEKVTLTATVSPPSATGTVTFMDGAGTLGTVPVSGGTAVLSVSTLSVGSHTISATFTNSDGCYASSSAGAVSHDVNLAPSSASLTSDINPSVCGEKVTLTAAVSPTGATGSVDFYEGATLLGTAPVSGGVATLSISTLTVGKHDLTANYSGDACYSGSSSSPYSQTVDLAPSSVSLASDINPSLCGQKVTLTATVSPVGATGTVEFFEGATSLGTSPVAGGIATLSISTLTVGKHDLTANYSGDACYSGSSSAPYSQTVDQAPSSVSLTSDLAKSDCGQKVNLIATVSPSGATGSVDFYDGATPLGSGAVSGGVATLSISTLSEGKHDLTASYSGDACYTGSSSPSYSQEVNPVATNTILTSDVNPSVCGQKVNLTATVSPLGATGIVSFTDLFYGPLGTAPVDPQTGQAVLSVSNLYVGTRQIQAMYEGDACHSSSSHLLFQQVTSAPSTTDLFVDPPKTGCGEKVTLTAQVTPADPYGVVQFFDGATPLGGGQLDANGRVTLSVTNLSVGTHNLSAQYSGNPSCYDPSTSPTVTHEVNLAQTSVYLYDYPSDKTACGEKVDLIAYVYPQNATGTVQFYDGANPLGPPVPLSFGFAQLSWSDLAVGTHNLTATYSGDACYAGSTSDPNSHEVNPAPSTTDMTVDPPKTVCGEKVTLTATVSPAGATGTVTFLDGASPIGTAPVDASGQAVLSITTLAVGTQSLTAQYSGDACYAPSESPKVTHEVNPAPSTTDLTVDPPKTVCGEKVTLTATVSPAGATGTVEFFDGASSLGIAPVDASGLAVLSITTLSVGTHSLTAKYSGDACYAPSESPKVTHEVNPAPTAVDLFVDPPKTFCGEKVALVAQVSPAGATGAVQFFDGPNPLGPPVPVDATGRAELSTSTLAVGPHSLSARYLGDPCHAPSLSNKVVHEVNPVPTTVDVASDVTTAKFGTKVTLTATVTPANATGTVQFLDGGNPIDGPVPVAGGVATLSVTDLTVGSHQISGAYSGDACYAPSTSAPIKVDIIADNPPVVHVVSPNGGETFLVGNTYKLQWTATDDNEVQSVKLWISRNNGATYQAITGDLPGDGGGTYQWTVTPPGTNTNSAEVFSALFKVTALDDVKQPGEDTSDAPFSILDLATETVVTRLEASPGELGVVIKWALGGRGLFGTVELERSEAEAGPWRVVEAQRHEEGDLTVAEDRTAEAGRKYWYRLIGVTNTGVRAVLGTVAAEAASFKEFALGRAWPNPSRGERVQVEFVVAREAGVKLSVVDVTGREVEVLAEGTYRPGRYQASWDERTERGPVAAGVYFLRFEIPGKKALVSRIAVAR